MPFGFGLDFELMVILKHIVFLYPIGEAKLAGKKGPKKK